MLDLRSNLILNAELLDGIVLRYGQLYGPGTGSDTPSGSAPLHVDTAAWAALLAIDKGGAGIYNVADENLYVAVEKARRELGWESGLRLAGS